MKKRYAIILAAGKGNGMMSKNQEFSKVGYPILGKPIINYVLDAVKPLVDEIYVVVGVGGITTEKLVGDAAKTVWQHEILGTGHAVMQVSPYLKGKEGDVIIINGDTPLLTTNTLGNIINKYEKTNSKLTICSTCVENPKGYGRVIRQKPSYRVSKVLPYAELDPEAEENDVEEVNSGIYIVDNTLLQHYLPLLNRENKKDEYYLSDIVEMFVKDEHIVEAYVNENAEDVYNINDRVQLAYAAKLMQKRINHKLMKNGVSMEDPSTSYISPEVTIGADTVIFPNTKILGKSSIGERNFIGPNTILDNVNVGNNNQIIFSSLKNIDIGDDEIIGPYESK